MLANSNNYTIEIWTKVCIDESFLISFPDYF